MSLLSGFDHSVDFGFAESGDGCDFSDGLALGAEFGDVLLFLVDVFVGLFPQVGRFCGEFEEFEVDVAVGLFDFVEEDVGGIVAVFSGSDFELFDIAEVVVFGGLADGKYGVEEVVEFFAAGEVVLGDGACEAAFGCVGYDEERPAVAFFEVHQFHHKESCVDAFVAAVA